MKSSKNIIDGIQYISFMIAKEADYDYNFGVTPLDLDTWEEATAKRNENRSLERWVQEEIGWKIERVYKDISFFFRITLPEYFVRGKRGWASSDTWNLDGYLSDIIKESVLHLRKNVHGHPCGLKNMRQWESILKKIAWTFSTAKKMGDDYYYIPTKEHTRKHYSKIKKQFKSCNHLHIMTKTESLKYEEGWKFFQEYFQNLWD